MNNSISFFPIFLIFFSFASLLLRDLQSRENGTLGRFFILNIQSGLILSGKDLAIDTSKFEHYIEEAKITIGMERLDVKGSDNKIENEASKKSLCSLV